MGVIDRIVERLLNSEVPLERGALERAATALIDEEAPLGGPDLVTNVVDLMVGMGPIEQLLREPTVSDVLVNADGSIWVERDGQLEQSSHGPMGPAAVVAAIERVIAPLGLRIDRSSPAVDARLEDGSRLHAIVPPAAVGGPVLAVRRFTNAISSLDDLVAAQGLDSTARNLLTEAVQERRNILISGGTGAGKTTLLNVLGGCIPAGERTVTVEDAAELQIPGHVVRLESRAANAEGAGAISIAALVRHALRLRPDRIIVGEVRGAEAFDMIQAMSTGHPGSMSTVHANSPDEALWRVETMALIGAQGIAHSVISRQLRSAIDYIVQVVRTPHGLRRVTEIADVGSEVVETVWRP